METRIRILLLTSALLFLSGCASVRNWLDNDEPAAPAAPETSNPAVTAEGDAPAQPRVIDPEVARRTIKVPKIDTENVEVGAYIGALSIEDFGTNPVYGVQAAYHVTEDFFFQLEYGRSEAGRTSFEVLAGNIQLLSRAERRFTYYNLALGYNFLPGEVFLGRGLAMNSSFYLTGGIGSVEFAGDDRFALSFGAGYRLLPTDWLAVHVAVQDRLIESDLLGSSKLKSNLEAHIGATVFF
jgi:outer membrane beta-barrel protein